MLDNTRKSAFTLAEVLITLGIIGVVAALTLPSLVANYKEKVMISQAKKGLSVVLNTLSKTRARLEVENNGEIFDSNNTPDQTADLFFANMNVASRCNSAGYCNFFRNYNIKFDKPINDGYGNYRQPFDLYSYAKAVLNDGMIVAIHQTKYPEGNCTNYYTTWDKDSKGYYILDSSGNKMNERKVKETDCGHILFDVNGIKGPNQLGADVYLIYITPYGYIQSYGYINDVIQNNKLHAVQYDINGKFE